MSLGLSYSGDIEARTFPNFLNRSGPDVVIIGDVEATMPEALADMNKELLRADVASFFAISGLRRYLKSLYPTRMETGVEILSPHFGIIFPLGRIHSESSSALESEILGSRIAGYDFPFLVDYILTNTFLTGENDPRLCFLAELCCNLKPPEHVS